MLFSKRKIQLRFRHVYVYGWIEYVKCRRFILFFFLQSDQSLKAALEQGGEGESVIHVSKFSKIAPN